MNIEKADATGLSDVGTRYLIAKRVTVEPHTYLAFSHETGLVIAEAENLDELHAVMFAHGWLHEEI